MRALKRSAPYTVFIRGCGKSTIPLRKPLFAIQSCILTDPFFISCLRLFNNQGHTASSMFVWTYPNIQLFQSLLHDWTQHPLEGRDLAL
jgi:hypothetical protein